MFKNYFKIAWRSLFKNKMHSAINIAGLSVGMAVVILIGLWITDELSFNKSFKHYDRIAQVIQNVTNNGEVQTWREVPFPLAAELSKNYAADFKHVVIVSSLYKHILTINDKKIRSNGGFFGKGVGDMLSLKMLSGTANGSDDPTSILISASAARAYFGTDDPINKIVKIDDIPPVKVSGIYEDLAGNSTFAGLDFISSWDFLYQNTDYFKGTEDPWRPNSFALYVQLADNADMKNVSLKIRDAKLRNVNAQLAKKKPALFLQPMSRLHLHSEFENGVNTGGAIRYVWMFGIIGIFVMLLACINFMNLSTARSEKRAKEVGIRKTLGSRRAQLMLQFFSESLLIVIFSFVLSLLLVRFSLPDFNLVAGKQISIPWTSSIFWMVSLGFMLLTAFIAGSYPAFYLSSFKPVKVLKGTFKAGSLAAIPRKALVVLQFTVSVSLIIGTIIVYRQIQFAKSRADGYNAENLIAVTTENNLIHDHFEAIRNELVQAGTVSSMAEAESSITCICNSTSGFSWPGKDPDLSIDFGVATGGFDYGKTIGWEIAQGRDFSRSFATDSSAVILNEAAVKYMGLKNPVGQTAMWWGQPLSIIGVVKDMVMESPYNEPKPTIYTFSGNKGNVALIKLSDAKTTEAGLHTIGEVFKRYSPAEPFEYQFVGDEYFKKFGNEERVARLSSFFAMLTIAISCLGLFGLTSFIAEQRKKEIGVRKVLGASVYNVWNLLNKDFVWLVLISFLIASPIAWFAMHSWLENYHYRSAISWWIFAVAGLGTLAITLITVSFQAIKAAIANPVKSLRTE